MPRLRRAAMQRRERPQLNQQIWLWLQGKKTYDELATQFQLLVEHYVSSKYVTRS